MFDSFKDVWSPVALSADVGGEPHAVVLAREELVVFRDEAGQAGVLVDRCPHRGTRLSLGTRTEGGCLTCPFHGWQFGTDGACRRTPLNVLPPSRSRFDATAVHSREAGGLIWVFTGDAQAAPPLPIPPGLLGEGTVTSRSDVWEAHWTRVIENTIDFAHPPFLHSGSIGRFLRDQLTPQSQMTVRAQEEENGAMVFSSALDGHETAFDIRWVAPNRVSLDLPGPSGLRRSHVWAIPTRENQTRRLVVTEHAGPVSADFERFAAQVAQEDQRIVESQRPKEIPRTEPPVSVGTDTPSLVFGRYYQHSLRET